MGNNWQEDWEHVHEWSQHGRKYESCFNPFTVTAILSVLALYGVIILFVCKALGV